MHDDQHDEFPNDILMSRRMAMGCGLGAMFVPVSGLLGSALAAPMTDPVGSALRKAVGTTEGLRSFDVCMVATQTVEGPYFIDKQILRSDIRDGQKGRKLRLELQVTNANNFCKPVEGALVSIWHCNAEGEYSAYLDSDPNSMPPMSKVDPTGHMVSTTPERFLRGAQITDREGKVSFTTIYPGWYTPRALHIHTRVHLNQKQLITTQLYFPQALTDLILSTDADYKARGTSIYTNENDIVRRQSGVAGMEDVLGITVEDDGSLSASRTLGASYV